MTEWWESERGQTALHECAHAAVARSFGYNAVPSLEFGECRYEWPDENGSEGDAETVSREHATIALAGPALVGWLEHLAGADRVSVPESDDMKILVSPAVASFAFDEIELLNESLAIIGAEWSAIVSEAEGLLANV